MMATKTYWAIPAKVIELIVRNYGIAEAEAVDLFYNSQVYAWYEDEETGFWHFDPLLLFQLFNEEKTTGKITLPEMIL
ncbi:hypothetical protein AGMMS4957_22500 [Bacteroidia bacterium]|nr:hypothetical protein AGMMS4957_22500 [Bacteroidia bacterium]